MNIQSINSVYQNNSNKTSFKGYINGNYYTDSIIKASKDALKNSNWEQELLAKRVSFLKQYIDFSHGSNLHRVLFAIMSLGMSEFIFAGLYGLNTYINNGIIKETIKDMKHCIKDLNIVETQNK